MPTVRCPKCGTVVRFEGIAGLCPKCATVVRVPSAKPASPASKPARSIPTETSRIRGRKLPADLSGLDGDEEQFMPAEAAPVEGPPDPTLRYVIIGTVAVFLLFGVYLVLQAIVTHFASNTVAPPPPPAPLHLNATVEPDAEAPVVAPAPPPPIANRTPDTRPAASQPVWATLNAIVPQLPAAPITDASVASSIRAGVSFLKTQFANDELLDPKEDSDLFAGQDAISVYALLNAGKAVDDPDLNPTSPFMRGLLDHLRKFPINKELATYGRSLRLSAYSVYDRDVDRDQSDKDRQWLLKSESKGSYTYSMPPPLAKGEQPPADPKFDNSNSQYGLLGIWAASQVGASIPDKYWVDVENHWLDCQIKTGGWRYTNAGPMDPSLTMTCAGITSLCVTAEQLELIAGKGKRDALPQMSQAISLGADWLGKGNRLTTILRFHGYTLYSIERAALATGFRYFGDHDWYRELGAMEIEAQHPNGSWGLDDDEEGFSVGTAFRLLFLSRGRQPLFADKLRFDGDWNDRPRDVAKLVQFASAQLEKPFAWGVADLQRNWWDWLESPLLIITTDSYPKFTDEECKKLRSYTDAGGLIFVHNEYASKEVDSFVADLAQRAYPDLSMTKAAATDSAYSAVFTMKTKPLLGVIGNGIRPFLIYSAKDLTQDWVRFKPKDSRQNTSLQLGLNLFVTAAGKSDFRNRLASPYEAPADFPAIGTVPVLQISYPGGWNPEPMALEFFSRWFQKQTSIKLDVKPTDLRSLSAAQAPVAFMTGDGGVDFSKMDLHAIHDYVRNGGVLLIDSAGGDKNFADAVRDVLLPTAFPEAQFGVVPNTHPIFMGGGPCMDNIPKPKLRGYASLALDGVVPSIQYAEVGQGAILFSDLDLTEGLLKTSTYAITGYTPAYCQSLAKNVILWAMHRSASVMPSRSPVR